MALGDDEALRHDWVGLVLAFLEVNTPGLVALRLAAEQHATGTPGLVVAIPGRDLGEPATAVVSHFLREVFDGVRLGHAVVQIDERLGITLPDPTHDARLPEGGHEHLALERVPQRVHNGGALIVPAGHQLDRTRVDEVVEVAEAVDDRVGSERLGQSFVRAVHELVEPVLLQPALEVRVPGRARRGGHGRGRDPGGLHAVVDVAQRLVEPDLRVHTCAAQRGHEGRLLPDVLGPLVRAQHDEPAAAQHPDVAAEHRGRQPVAVFHGVGHALPTGAGLELGDDRAVLSRDRIGHDDDVGAHEAHVVADHQVGDATRLAEVEHRAQGDVVVVEFSHSPEAERERAADAAELVQEVARQLERFEHLAPGDAIETLVADPGRVHALARSLDFGASRLADLAGVLGDARRLIVAIDHLGFDEQKRGKIRRVASDLGRVDDVDPAALNRLAALDRVGAGVSGPVEPENAELLLQGVQHRTVLGPVILDTSRHSHTVELDRAGEDLFTPALGRTACASALLALVSVLAPGFQHYVARALAARVR